MLGIAHLKYTGVGGKLWQSKGFLFLDVCSNQTCGLVRYQLNRSVTVTIFGLVFGAERALVEFENKKRREENALRQEARIALARRGLIGTETEIAQWKAEKASERPIHRIQS